MTLHSESDPVESEWRELAERRGNGFLTPEWFRAWLRAYGDDVEPFVPLVRAPGGSLRGLLPVALPRSGPPRVCRLAGANLGDRFHPVCAEGDEAAVASEVGRSLAEQPEPWSIVSLIHVETEPPWLEALAEGTGVRLRIRERVAGPLPYVKLAVHESWESYLQSRSSNFRQQVRRFTRRAAEAGSMRLRRTERAEELPGDMKSFFRLHDLRLGPEAARRSRANGPRSSTSTSPRRPYAGAGCGSGSSSWTDAPPPAGTDGGSADGIRTTTADSTELLLPAARLGPVGGGDRIGVR